MLVRTNIYLPKEVVDLLKLKAKSEKKTMAAVIRKLLRKEVENTKTDWVESMLELAKKAPKSNIGDLSRRHDYYLYGKGRK
ncbi:ribbon-helix-helix protein, CopG family [Candidatus Gottesmanbacteria bacterium]|nr:ribbon-helix-helix protein, CopG family [Candidatus Gottesmanbacteria bacterium]